MLQRVAVLHAVRAHVREEQPPARQVLTVVDRHRPAEHAPLAPAHSREPAQSTSRQHPIPAAVHAGQPDWIARSHPFANPNRWRGGRALGWVELDDGMVLEAGYEGRSGRESIAWEIGSKIRSTRPNASCGS